MGYVTECGGGMNWVTWAEGRTRTTDDQREHGTKEYDEYLFVHLHGGRREWPASMISAEEK